MRRLLLVLAIPVLLAACGFTAEPKWSPDNEVSAAIYRHNGPPSISLYTVISNATGSGAHSALLINGSQRIMFDPAGTWWHPQIPERNDVHFGITPRVLEFYEDYHTRVTYHTVVQTIEVSPQVAEMALRAAQQYGAVPKAQCSVSVTSILGSLPGFQSIPRSWFPKATMRNFAALPGVTTQTLYDDDSDDNKDLLAQQPSP